MKSSEFLLALLRFGLILALEHGQLCHLSNNILPIPSQLLPLVSDPRLDRFELRLQRCGQLFRLRAFLLQKPQPLCDLLLLRLPEFKGILSPRPTVELASPLNEQRTNCLDRLTEIAAWQRGQVAETGEAC